MTGACLKGGNHAADRLVEQQFDGLLQQPGAELEIDKEVDLATLLVGQENPVVAQILERTVGVFHVDTHSRGVQHDIRGEALEEHLEAEDRKSTRMNSSP